VADAERREAAKQKVEAKEKKLEADENLHLAAKTNNVRRFSSCFPASCLAAPNLKVDDLCTSEIRARIFLQPGLASWLRFKRQQAQNPYKLSILRFAAALSDFFVPWYSDGARRFCCCAPVALIPFLFKM